MLITEKQKQKYIEKEHLIYTLQNLSKTTEVRNVPPPEKNKPYLLKSLFGSKKGLLVKASKLNKDIEKIYKTTEKIRKNGIAPKYLSKRYFNELLDKNFISQEQYVMLRGYEKTLEELEKDIKKLGKKINNVANKIDLFDHVNSAFWDGKDDPSLSNENLDTLTFMYGTTGGGVAMAAIGFVVATAAAAPLLGPAAIVVGGLGAGLGVFVSACGPSQLAGGISALIVRLIKEKADRSAGDYKSTLQKIEKDFERCQSYHFPGVPPHLIFVKDGNGRIGVPISNYLVAFEPQADIRNFYNKYNKFSESFDNFLKNNDVGLFYNSSLSWEDIRPLWKQIKDQQNLVDTTVSMAKKLVKKLESSHKGSTPDDKNSKWKESDTFIYSLAEYLSKLTYKGLNTEEMKAYLKSKKALQSNALGDKTQTYLQNLKSTPNVTVDTSSKGVVPLQALAASTPVKPQTLTIIPSHNYSNESISNLTSSNNNEATVAQELNMIMSSKPDDYSLLKPSYTKNK